MADFCISVAEIRGLANATIGSGDLSQDRIADLVVRDPEFYFTFLREHYYIYHATNIWNYYPDLTFKEFNDTLRDAIVAYIRSFFPESMRGGVLV